MSPMMMSVAPKTPWKNYVKSWRPLYYIPNGLSHSASIHPRGCYYMGLQGLERLFPLGPSPIGPMPALFVSSDPSWSKNMSVREQEWSENCSPWPDPNVPVLY